MPLNWKKSAVFFCHSFVIFLLFSSQQSFAFGCRDELRNLLFDGNFIEAELPIIREMIGREVDKAEDVSDLLEAARSDVEARSLAAKTLFNHRIESVIDNKLAPAAANKEKWLVKGSVLSRYNPASPENAERLMLIAEGALDFWDNPIYTRLIQNDLLDADYRLVEQIVHSLKLANLREPSLQVGGVEPVLFTFLTYKIKSVQDQLSVARHFGLLTSVFNPRSFTVAQNGLADGFLSNLQTVEFLKFQLDRLNRALNLILPNGRVDLDRLRKENSDFVGPLGFVPVLDEKGHVVKVLGPMSQK